MKAKHSDEERNSAGLVRSFALEQEMLCCMRRYCVLRVLQAEVEEKSTNRPKTPEVYLCHISEPEPFAEKDDHF